MPKRRSREGGGVSLFPFMSILACLIGILTLMISVMMQLQEIDDEGKSEEDLSRALANRDLGKQAEELRQKIAEAEKKAARENSRAAELSKLKDRNIVLTMKLEELTKAQEKSKTDAELQKLVENQKQEISSLQKERPALQKQLVSLQAKLKELKEAPKPKPSVLVRPGGIGSRVARNLFFVDCTATGIVIMEPDKKPRTISTAAIGTNPEYNRFLDRVKKTRDSMVLFLVRTSGNNAYRWAAGWAESKYEVTTGKLPIPNDGPIDLSLFDQ